MNMNRTRFWRPFLRLYQRNQSILIGSGISSHHLPTKPFEDIPGPRGVYQWPYIGLALQLYPFTNYPLLRFDQRAKGWNDEFGNICRVRFGRDWVVHLFDPNDVQKVFRQDSKYPHVVKLPLFDTYNKRRNRIPTMAERSGEDWRKLRKTAQKNIARPKPMAKYIPQLSLIADDFVDICRNEHALHGLPHPFMELATESVGMFCFNTRLGCLAQAGSEQNFLFMSHVKTYFDYFGKQLLAPVKWFQWFPTPGYRKFEVASDYIMSVADTYVERCLKDVLDGNTNQDDVSLIQDLFDNPEMTSASISSVLIDFFRGGIESTANTLMFVLYHLAKNSDKQDILYEELKSPVSPRGPMEENSLHNLGYLKACVRESMRLIFPVSFGTSRTLDQDIEVQGYRVPAGTMLSLNTGIICKNENYFPEPEKFLPERWMRQNKRRDIHPYAFLPFGFGPRMCIGQRFAEQEVHIVLAKIIRNFRVKLPDDFTELSVVYRTFATVDKPFSMKLEPRERDDN